jgi:RTX calcium-binding nonapeptide repeat (4 copies)/WD40-like Beta Propeller Repeat
MSIRTIGIILLSASSIALPAVASATAPSGGTGRIFFVRDADPGPGTDQGVHVMNADGSGRVNLTPEMANNQSRPDVDSTGNRVVFGSASGFGEIWTMRSDGTEKVELLPGDTLDFGPVFSPDGSKIAFYRDANPGMVFDTDLWLMNPDGTGVVRLTNTPDVSEVEPDFSPDGTRIAFNATVSPSNDDIFSIGVNGQGLTTLVGGPTDDSQPVYSPDGKRLVFTRGPQDQLHIAGADGSSPVNVTPTWIQEALFPSWSPNGAAVAFDDDNQSLFTVASAGGPVSALQPDDDQADGQPDWEHVFTCAGRRATIVGDDGPDRIKGTKTADVIVANAGKDIVRGRGGNDRICGGRGKDQLRGNNGRDRILGQAGADLLAGGRAADVLKGGKGKDKERQ